MRILPAVTGSRCARLPVASPVPLPDAVFGNGFEPQTPGR
jgi:hypothetical protein